MPSRLGPRKSAARRTPYDACLQDGTEPEDPRPRCLVILGLPCAYFDRCLTPLCIRHAEWEGALTDYLKRTKGWQGRVSDLDSMHPHLGHDPKLDRLVGTQGRQCECGATLSRRQRKCDVCREKARRVTFRQATAKRRSGVNS